MSVTSTVGLVRGALISALDTQVTAAYTDPTNRPYVSFSAPLGVDMPSRAIYNGDVREGSHQIATMRAGAKAREETYVTEVVIACGAPEGEGGEGSAAAEALSYGLLEILETILSDDPNLGVGGTCPTLRATLEDFEHQSTPNEATRGWLCRLTVGVRVNARLDPSPLVP